MQYVEIELRPTRSSGCQAGSFMMMENGIKMETILAMEVKTNNKVFLVNCYQQVNVF